MVPSNLSGISNSLRAALARRDLSLDNSSRLEGVSEKNATSDPEIKAEHINNNIRITNPTTTPDTGG